MTKKYINIRPMFVTFLGLMAGVAISYLFLCDKINYFTALLVAMLVVFISIYAFIYAKYTESWNKFYYARRNVSAMIKVSSVLFMFAFVIGVVISSFPIYRTLTIDEYYDDVKLTGVVGEYVLEKETYTAFVLIDATIDGKNSQDILLYTSSYTDIELGDIVEINTDIDALRVNEKYEMSHIIKDIAYTGYVSYDDIEILGNDASLKDKFKTGTKDILESRLSDDNSDIMHSIIFGESNVIDNEIGDTFDTAGISHILAVSGLHVSVLFGLLYFILKKCRVKKKYSCIILSILLFIYSYLCSFSPSVCRASIMAILMLICEIKQIEYDGLSSLSIAGIIILLCSPLQFFSISFRLSFLCVFAIISFAPFITRLFTKMKLPEKFAQLLAMSISINIVTLPIMLDTFSKVSLLGILANIVVVPLFSVLYSFVLPIVLLAFIIKGIGVLLYIPNMILHLIKIIADYISLIPFAVFRAFNVGYILLFLVAVLCIVIHFLMVSSKIKIFISLMLVTIITTYLFCEAQPHYYSQYELQVRYSRSSTAVYYLSEDSVTIVGANITKEQIDRNLRDMCLSRVDSIVAYDLDISKINELYDICVEYGVENLILHSDYENLVSKERINTIFYDDTFAIDGLKFSTINYYERIPAIKCTMGDKDIIIAGEINTSQARFIQNEYAGIDYLILNELILEDAFIDEFQEIICNKTEKVDAKNILNLKNYGKITIRA